MKPRQFHIAQHFRFSWLLLPGLLFLASWLPADDSIPGGFPELAWGSGVHAIKEVLGTPGFSTNSILIYATAVVTGSGPLPADLTLWFQDDALFFASYAFSELDQPNETLISEYESISEVLLLKFGLPSSRAQTAGMFTTEVWSSDDMGIEHTLILEPGRVDHLVNFTFSGPQRAESR